MVAQHFYAVLLFFGCLASFITLRERNKHLSADFQNTSNFDEKDYENDSFMLRENDFYKYASYFVWNNTDKEDETKLQKIYIQGLFEIDKNDGLSIEGYSEKIAAQLAINHVNKYKILPGFSLKLLTNNTKCDPGVALDRFFHALYSKHTIIMVLTGNCSAVTEALANVVPYWNILQISYGSMSPILSDRKKFPLFFRTVAVTSSHNNARIAFIKHFKWETVVILSENEEHYLLPLNNFVKEMELANISCAATVTFSKENLLEQLKSLKELDVRVIVGSFSPLLASRVFCEAYHLRMFGSEYVWILQDDDDLWWENPKVCDYKNLLIASDGIFLVANQNILSDKNSVHNLTTDNFLKQLTNLNSTISRKISGSASLVYDAIWTMAFTMREAIECCNLSPGTFTYKNRHHLEVFLKIMKKMRFVGMSGPLIFKGSDRIGTTVFKHLQRGQLNPVAVFNPLSINLDFLCKDCKPIRWKGGQIPVARRILRKRLEAIPKLALYTISSVSCLGIIFSAIFLYFNLHFRQMKTVKLSSPYMNNTAIVGCMIVYLAVTILGIDSSFLPSKDGFTYLCITRVYLLSAGFSLTFGSLFAKTYRIHRIFTYRKTSFIKDKFLKDKPLIALVCLLLIIDGIIVTLWSLIDPMKYNLYDLPIEMSSINKGVAYQPQVETCRSENTLGWFIAMYGYKGILLMMVVYMAWETRRVKIPELNDSQYIGICVYSVLSSTLVIILSNLIPNHPTISYLTTAISILAATTIIVILLFLPKLKSILARTDDAVDPIEKSMGLKTEFNTRRFLVDDPKDLIYRLEAQNKVYRNEIQLLDQEIDRLENQLAQTTKQSNFSALGLFLKQKRGSYCCEYGLSNLKTETGIGRASWPTETCQEQKSSQNYLFPSNSGTTLYDQMKKLFGSISLVWHFKADDSETKESDSMAEIETSVIQEGGNDEERWLFHVASAVQYSHKNKETNEEQNYLKERY